MLYVRGTPVSQPNDMPTSTTATLLDINPLYASNSPEPMFITSSASMPTSTDLAAEYKDILTMSPDVPPELKDKLPLGIPIWLEYSKSFAVIIKSVCDSSSLKHSGPLIPNWPIVMSVGYSLSGSCDRVDNAMYSIEDAQHLFSDYAKDIKKAVKIVIGNQPDATSAGERLLYLLNSKQLPLDSICSTDFKYMGAATCGNNYAIILTDNTWNTTTT
ncbi:hypothetical protein IW141_003437 [Coemansia sp. RSA 355]|nr:hypothetical protein IW141_003437 [Coemansia sp. RSA 355]